MLHRNEAILAPTYLEMKSLAYNEINGVIWEESM
jgi:hypothetical protein